MEFFILDLSWFQLKVSNILGHTKESPGQQWVSSGSRSIKKSERITLESRWACRFPATTALRTGNQRCCPSGCWEQEVAVSIWQVRSRFHYYQRGWKGMLKRCSVFFSAFLTQFLWFVCTTDHRVETHIPQHWVRWNPAKDCFAVFLPPSSSFSPAQDIAGMLAHTQWQHFQTGKYTALVSESQMQTLLLRFIKKKKFDCFRPRPPLCCTYLEDEAVLYC